MIEISTRTQERLCRILLEVKACIEASELEGYGTSGDLYYDIVQALEEVDR